jgi:hypothetical protein
VKIRSREKPEGRREKGWGVEDENEDEDDQKIKIGREEEKDVQTGVTAEVRSQVGQGRQGRHAPVLVLVLLLVPYVGKARGWDSSRRERERERARKEGAYSGTMDASKRELPP